MKAHEGERFWEYVYSDTESGADAFDELPLWSAPFGLLLLREMPMRRNAVVLDVGPGCGFPLLEIAERLGEGSHCYGIDPWKHAVARARRKARQYGLANVTLLEGSADRIPLEDEIADIAVSNLGINNFDDAQGALRECRRVMKVGADLCITTNVQGHWTEFYQVVREVLAARRRGDLLTALLKEEGHRKSTREMREMLSGCGFTVVREVPEEFAMRFLDGSSFLRHHFVQLGWLRSWTAFVPEADRKEIFSDLETALNTISATQEELRLRVPALYIEAKRK